MKKTEKRVRLPIAFPTSAPADSALAQAVGGGHATDVPQEKKTAATTRTSRRARRANEKRCSSFDDIIAI